MIQLLLSAFGVALIVSALACLVALQLFPWFRSGERKTGDFRPDQSGGASGSQQIEIVTGRTRRRQARVRSSELPLVGGPAMLLAVVVACGVAGLLLNFSFADWELLGVLMAALLGFGVVGFIDDARKVYKGSGISELQKFIGVFLVAGLAAAGLNRLLASPALSARLAYSPYNNLPLLGSILVHTHYTWLAFFLLLTIGVTTTTALAVDFSDGMDGLSGGLLLSASLSYAVILLDEGTTTLWPLTIVLLAMAGATLGYLPFNWPSSWRGGDNPSGKRRARLIMGDTGSLALGGLLALVAIVSRLELLLVLIGGAFVLEGLSALMQGRILVRIFRRFLFVERFNSPKGFPHTEFPLPFLATPMHHHYELLGWDRRRLVYGAWLLGAGLGVLGIASVMGPFTWERYLARFAGFIVLLFVWQIGSWTRTFFVGLTPTRKDAPDAPRYLALYSGAPFKFFGWPLYARIDLTHATPDALTTTAERLSLWQLMNVFDARSLLGYYCYQADQIDDAVRIWDRIPTSNLRMRPEISQLLTESRHRRLIETAGSDEPLSRIVNDGAPPLTEIPNGAQPNGATSARTTGVPVPVGANAAAIAASGASALAGAAIILPPPTNGVGVAHTTTVIDGRPATRVTPPLRTIGQVSQLGQGAQILPRSTGAPVNQGGAGASAADPSASAWRMSKPTTGILPIPRLQPTEGQAIPATTVASAPISPPTPPTTADPVFWNPTAWAVANPTAFQSEEELGGQTAPQRAVSAPMAAPTTPDVVTAALASTSPIQEPAEPTAAPKPLARDPLIVPTLTPSAAPVVAPSAQPSAAPDVEPTKSPMAVIEPEPTEPPMAATALPPPARSQPADTLATDAPLTQVTATLAVAPDAAEATTAPRVKSVPPVPPVPPHAQPNPTPEHADTAGAPTALLAEVGAVANVRSAASATATAVSEQSEPALFIPPTLDSVILTTEGGESAN